ncbi:MAG: hypothetical protein ABIO86_10350 [Sphingomonas sp.]
MCFFFLVVVVVVVVADVSGVVAVVVAEASGVGAEASGAGVEASDDVVPAVVAWPVVSGVVGVGAVLGGIAVVVLGAVCPGKVLGVD